MTNRIVDKINHYLETHYPVAHTTFKDMASLSHCLLYPVTITDSWLPFAVSIEGKVRGGGAHPNAPVRLVVTHDKKRHSWRQYLQLYHDFLPLRWHYRIAPDKFVRLLHQESRLSQLRIASLVLGDAGETQVEYKSAPRYKVPLWQQPKYPPKVAQPNHFYLHSFSVNDNREELSRELPRLFARRDEFKSVHLHLDDNGGGDNIPGQLITRCLVGRREKWMLPVTKLLTAGEKYTWDCWREDERVPNNGNYEAPLSLGLGVVPQYPNKYSGKVFVYMNERNGSAAWYFITYLVYAFGKSARRWQETVLGQRYKFGAVAPDSQLVLVGRSETTSGDGNARIFKIAKGIEFECPTQQFVKCSVQEKDWSRFWVGRGGSDTKN